MAILLQAKDRLLSRLKSLTKIQLKQRFNHTLEPQMCREMCSDSFNQEVDVSNWKTVDSRNLGITRAMIPQPSWVVLKILKSQGFQAYLVGGCVRDLLLRRVPKDFDVITTANLKQIRRQFHRSEIIGRRFPICRVHIKGSVIEVSSFETVAKHGEGKEMVLLSQIPYGCDEIDLVRWRNSIHRDFTINSLFFDPFLNKIYDYANGISDLRCLKLRTLIPAYLSFTEDCARILRGLRIAARLGLSFCKDIDTAMHSLSSSIERLDKSRIMMELNYMLSYGAAESSICLLRRYNLLKILLPFHAAYLDQQAGKITAENPMMLMRLFFNLDKLVSCDRPADYTLWVGLLSFHQALVSDPQDAFVVWVFASVLYHGKWKEGVKFARDRAKEPVKFVPEISGFSEIESDEQLAVKVTELALSVQDCVNDLTKASSGYVFVSKKIERNVQQIFDGLVNSIESYNSGKRSHIIDYDMLGKGNLVETRFVLGKIILKTISGGLVAGEEEIDEEEMPEVLDKDSVENYLAKKNRKRGLQPSSAELKLKTAKKCKWTEKFSSINHELSMNKEDVVPKEEVEEIHKAAKNCQLPDEELKVRTTEKHKWIENSCHFDQELSINEELVQKEGSQQLGEETQKAAKTCQSPEEEIKEGRGCCFRGLFLLKMNKMGIISDENNPNITKPTSIQGGLQMGGSKFGQGIKNNRRALGVISHNVVGPEAYPCLVNKRGFSENHAVCEKNELDPVHRPITRKFAAQIACNQQHCPEAVHEPKKPKTSVSDTNEFGDCIFIDVEEFNKAPTDQPEPMFLEESEESINEVDQMEEIEMEDIVEEPIVDIDSWDAKNPLAVVEYVEDLFSYYRKIESFSCVSPEYMTQQFDINEKMRAILIDWLIEVHDKFDLMSETLFLSINLIDRFLSQQQVVRKKLQLVGLVAMLLACKYEEVSVPVVGDLILISDKAYTRKEVLEMESLMLNTLQFNMSVPTPYVFIQRFLKAAQSDKKLQLLSFFLIELSLVEYEMLKFTPSLLAAAAIYAAQCTIYGFKQWSKTCQWHSGYSEDQLLECATLMIGFHQKAATGKLTGVHRKYCTSKFGYISKSEPAQFLLETKL